MALRKAVQQPKPNVSVNRKRINQASDAARLRCGDKGLHYTDPHPDANPDQNTGVFRHHTTRNHTPTASNPPPGTGKTLHPPHNTPEIELRTRHPTRTEHAAAITFEGPPAQSQGPPGLPAPLHPGDAQGRCRNGDPHMSAVSARARPRRQAAGDPPSAQSPPS